jgi:ketosteroid isomerase-like protein
MFSDAPPANAAATLGSASNEMEQKMVTTLHPGIQAANSEFMDAVRAGDEERFVRLYAEDAILLLPARDPLVGSAGVRTFFASFKARGVRDIQLATLEVEDLGETAWERGSFEMTGAEGSVLGRGKYIVIWKRAGDAWKLYRDIVNASS